MPNQKENLFQSKFRLLNSQEYHDDIKWTSSSSSEYGNTSNENENMCYFDKNKNRKRKRKKKVFKQVSNLDITIIDSNKRSQNYPNLQKSPILKSKLVLNKVSPILVPNKDSSHKESIATSPILNNKSFQPNSPIVQLKTASTNLHRVRKNISFGNNSTETNIASKCDDNLRNVSYENIDNNSIKSEAYSYNASDSTFKTKLVERVKSFFDSNFSSENTSQNISDTPTPTDKSANEEVDILSCKTQTDTDIYPQTVKVETSSNSDASSFDTTTKKIKYKKGGLAYRLNALIKKQNAQVCLWQHERFLAVNSNFVIPKEEYIAFHVQNIDYKYGCHLLSAVDLESNRFFIVINKNNLTVNMKAESVFKLYKPYTILPFEQDSKIIIDVCKFECKAL